MDTDNEKIVVHKLLVDGYTFGGRLLEGVLFEVPLEESSEGWRVLDEGVKPAPEAAAYASRLRWESLVPTLVLHVENCFDETLAYCDSQAITLEELMAEFHAETGEPGVQVILEVRPVGTYS